MFFEVVDFLVFVVMNVFGCIIIVYFLIGVYWNIILWKYMFVLKGIVLSVGKIRMDFVFIKYKFWERKYKLSILLR